MRDKVLLTITAITDDNTGIYNVGELDFGKMVNCEKFLAKPGNRDLFVSWLRWLADAAEKGKSPFLPLDGKLSIRMNGEMNDGGGK